MSPTAIFIIGAVVFALTVYGAVMAGGLALTNRQLDENHDIDTRTPEERGANLAPTDLEY